LIVRAGAGPSTRPWEKRHCKRLRPAGGALLQSGSKSELVDYPDTPLAFHADYRPS
jgi:hypothetical protein